MKLTLKTAKIGMRVKLLSSFIKHVGDIGTVIAIEESELHHKQAVWVKFDNCKIGCSNSEQGQLLGACAGYFYPEALETINTNKTSSSRKCICNFDIVMNLGCQCGGT